MRHPCATIADALEALTNIWSGDVPPPPRVIGDLAANMGLNRVHAQGWRESQVSAVASLHDWVRHLRKIADNGFPWCDTCKLPAVSSEALGKVHSTPGRPFGLHPERDRSGHEVTIQEWYDVPASELNR